MTKKDNTYRFCVDFGKYHVFDAESIPCVVALFVTLSGHNYFSLLDLSKGYWQVPLSPAARPTKAFQTPKGLFQFTKMPFRLVTAPSAFCRLVREALYNVLNVDNFNDDIFIFTRTIDLHSCVPSEVLERLHSGNITARPTKCSLAYQELQCLGHIVGDDKIHLHPDKVSAIQQANHTTTKKQLQSFLELENFYRKFVPNFAQWHIALPFTYFTRKFSLNKIQWTAFQDSAFENLKSAITKSPIFEITTSFYVFNEIRLGFAIEKRGRLHTLLFHVNMFGNA